MPNSPTPLVGIIMGSGSDWPVMQVAADTLTSLGVPHEIRVRSAHRLWDLLAEYSATAGERGIRLIIAGAGGGAAHLAGMAKVQAKGVPVIGVPVNDAAVASIREMPKGSPVATMATGSVGAENAAVFAAELLAYEYPEIARLLAVYQERLRQTALTQDEEVQKFGIV